MSCRALKRFVATWDYSPCRNDEMELNKVSAFPTIKQLFCRIRANLNSYCQEVCIIINDL